MRLRCRNCGIVQAPEQMREPADRVMRVDEKITVCWNCGSVYGDYVDVPGAWGEGVILPDGKRYFRVRDIPIGSPTLGIVVKWMHADPLMPTERMKLRDEDPDMLVARA